MKHNIDNSRIVGISSCLPADIIKIDENFSGVSELEVGKIKSITGIESVRYVDKNTTASDLSLIAARNLLNQLKVESSEIDAVIFVSQSRDYIAPTTSSILQDRLNLSKDVLAIDLPNGCSGYIHGLFLSKMLVSTGAASNVLLLCGETNSQLINRRDRSMTMIFGDAGTATLIAGHPGCRSYFNIKTDGSGYNKIIIPHGGSRFPSTSESFSATERENGNFRSDANLFMDGMSVFNFAITEVPKIISESLVDTGNDCEGIDLFALHQANQLIIRQISKKLKIDNAKMPFIASTVGNTGPASIPLLLSMGFADDTSRLHKVLMCGFGVGLNWGVSICDLSKTQIYSPVSA